MRKSVAGALIVVTLFGGTAAAQDHEDNGWKPIFFTSLALTLASTAFTGLSYVTMKSEAEDIEARKVGGQQITDEDCNDRSVLTGGGDEHFDNACTWRSRSRTGLMLTIGFGVVAVASAYFAFSGPSNVAVTPTVSADGAGATMLVRW